MRNNRNFKIAFFSSMSIENPVPLNMRLGIQP